jgi:hypothetical protein
MRPMRRPLLLALLAVASCGPGAPKLPDPETPQKLQFAAEVLSFGTKFDDDVPSLTATLKNVGGSTLHVERIEPGCGCILVAEAPKEIASGASVDLPMDIRLSGMEGPFSRVVAVYSDDPEADLRRVTIEGEVLPRIAVSPPAVVLRPTTLDETTRAELVVKSGSDEPIASLKTTVLSPGTSVTTALAASEARVSVVVAPFAEDFQGSIVLRLGKSERVIPVTGIAARDVRVAPDKLWIGSELRGKPVLAGLLPREGLGAWRVVSVETSRKDLIATANERELSVRIAQDAPKGRFEGTVVIVLEGAKPDRLRVQVTGWVSD